MWPVTKFSMIAKYLLVTSHPLLQALPPQAEHLPLGLCSSLDCPPTTIIMIITAATIELFIDSKLYFTHLIFQWPCEGYARMFSIIL